MPRRPGEPWFPAVSFTGDMSPVDHPQYIPPSPGNLPDMRDRPAQRSEQFIGQIPGNLPTVPPSLHSAGLVNDLHHYARLTESNAAVENSVSAIVLPEPTTRRNYLFFRNNSTNSNLYISFGRDASVNSPIKLEPGQSMLLDTVVPQDDMYAMADDTDGALVYAYSTIAAS